MTIQTVFFDMGGTIDTFWYSQDMRLHVTCDLNQLLKSSGINLDLSDYKLYQLITGGLARYHKWRLKSLDELPSAKVWQDYIFEDFPEVHKLIEPLADDLMVWIETHYYQRTMRPEIPSVLESINRMGYKIGLISNVNSLGQVPRNLKEYGIYNYFNPIVLSSEYKRRKPDPAIFHYAARLSDSPTSECIYIGDRISRDVLGAKRAGFRLAIQIRHDFSHGEPDEGATPDLLLNNMTELLEVLVNENPSQGQHGREKEAVKNIRAVLFDADGVLYYRKMKEQELSSFIKRHGNVKSGELVSDINRLRHEAFIGQLTFEQYKTAVLRMYGITDPDLISQGIRAARREKERIHFFDGTRETLESLKERDHYLGIITDTAQPLNVKIEKLERGGFGNLWDTIIPSSEVGVQKPYPEIYLLALKQLGIKSNQAVFVGHKASELDGAKSVGMTTVAFNYDPDAKADFYINDFSELACLPILN